MSAVVPAWKWQAAIARAGAALPARTESDLRSKTLAIAVAQQLLQVDGCEMPLSQLSEIAYATSDTARTTVKAVKGLKNWLELFPTLFRLSGHVAAPSVRLHLEVDLPVPLATPSRPPSRPTPPPPPPPRPSPQQVTISSLERKLPLGKKKKTDRSGRRHSPNLPLGAAMEAMVTSLISEQDKQEPTPPPPPAPPPPKARLQQPPPPKPQPPPPPNPQPPPLEEDAPLPEPPPALDVDVYDEDLRCYWTATLRDVADSQRCGGRDMCLVAADGGIAEWVDTLHLRAPLTRTREDGGSTHAAHGELIEVLVPLGPAGHEVLVFREATVVMSQGRFAKVRYSGGDLSSDAVDVAVLYPSRRTAGAPAEIRMVRMDLPLSQSVHEYMLEHTRLVHSQLAKAGVARASRVEAAQPKAVLLGTRRACERAKLAIDVIASANAQMPIRRHPTRPGTTARPVAALNGRSVHDISMDRAVVESIPKKELNQALVEAKRAFPNVAELKLTITTGLLHVRVADEHASDAFDVGVYLRTRLRHLAESGEARVGVDTLRRELRGVLPVDAHADEIVSLVAAHRVTFIAGETGCGKSSGVPLILRDAPANRSTRVFCSQPHRVAAAGLHNRLTSLGYDCGLRMGHGVREGDGPTTRLCFCTTGYLTALLSAARPSASLDFDLLIIDEVCLSSARPHPSQPPFYFSTCSPLLSRPLTYLPLTAWLTSFVPIHFSCAHSATSDPSRLSCSTCSRAHCS